MEIRDLPGRPVLLKDCQAGRVYAVGETRAAIKVHGVESIHWVPIHLLKLTPSGWLREEAS